MLIRLIAAMVGLSLVLVMAGHAFADTSAPSVGLHLPDEAASARISVPGAAPPVLAGGTPCCRAAERAHGGEAKPVQLGHPCTPDLACFGTQAPPALFLASPAISPDLDDSREGLPPATPLKPPRPLS